MKKRLDRVCLLSVAVLTTSVPVSTFADPSAGRGRGGLIGGESGEGNRAIRSTGELFRETLGLVPEYPTAELARERKTSENRGMNSVDGTTTRN